MNVDVKTVIGLFIFIVIGIILFSPIVSYVQSVTQQYVTYVTTSGTATVTTSSLNPNYAGSTGATLVALVPIFYLLILILVPAFIVWKMYKED